MSAVMMQLIHRRFGSMAALVLLFVALASAPASAATPQELSDCEAISTTDQSIAACTRIIERKSETLELRLRALRARAFQNKHRDRQDRALADHNELVRLKSDADHYWLRALFYLSQDKSGEALADFNEVIRLDPNGISYLQRGTALRQLGQEKAAQDDFERAVDSFTQEAMSEPYALHRRSEANALLGRYDAAAKDLSEYFAGRSLPVNDLDVLLRGDLYLKAGNFDRAIEDYTLLIAKRPKEARFYRRRALAYRANGEHAKAVADYNKLLDEEGDEAGTFNDRGLTLAAAGRLDLAIRNFTMAIEELEDETAYYNRAQALRLQGKYAEAMNDYDKAIELNRDFHVAYNSRGLLHLRLGNRKAAMDDFSRANGESNSAVYFNRGMTRFAAKDFNGARMDFDSALKVDPDTADYIVARGAAYAAQGDHADALKDYSAALRLAPLNARYYVLRAGVALKVRDLDSALDDVNRALLLDENLVAAYEVRMDIHLALGRADAAAADRRGAREARGRIAQDEQLRREKPKQIE
jgi:tetratricopeptide (TPR) repeat protein